jgi:hypothetical protein
LSDRSDRWLRMVGPALSATVPLLLLAVGPSSSPAWSVGTVVAGLGVALVLRGLGGARFRLVEGVPFAAALVLVCTFARPSPLTEVLSGLAGLGVLLWVGQDLAWRVPLARAARGLGLPAIGLALSLGIAFGLPAVQQSVGIATILAVVCLAGLGWALARPGQLSDPSLS